VPDLPEALVTYLVNRDTARADAVRAFLNDLTDRERGLIRDAAVMGYVRGRIHPADTPHPKDSHVQAAVLAEIIDSCHAMPDLYPAINAAPDTYQRTVEYFVQCQQPDDTWAQCSSTMTEPARVVEQLAAQQRARPELEFRIARRTTTAVIEVVAPIEETSP
jgi:hypothetical protein